MYQVQTTQNCYQAVNPNIRCKEEWLFELQLLDFTDEKSPARAFISYLTEKYETVKFIRQTYVTDEGYFQEPCGLSVLFTSKDEAESYAEELNSKY